MRGKEGGSGQSMQRQERGAESFERHRAILVQASDLQQSILQNNKTETFGFCPVERL